MHSQISYCLPSESFQYEFFGKIVIMSTQIMYFVRASFYYFVL
jgi:hypothetical protein